jgi:hypothetical protein
VHSASQPRRPAGSTPSGGLGAGDSDDLGARAQPFMTLGEPMLTEMPASWLSSKCCTCDLAAPSGSVSQTRMVMEESAAGLARTARRVLEELLRMREQHISAGGAEQSLLGLGVGVDVVAEGMGMGGDGILVFTGPGVDGMRVGVDGIDVVAEAIVVGVDGMGVGVDGIEVGVVGVGVDAMGIGVDGIDVGVGDMVVGDDGMVVSVDDMVWSTPVVGLGS